MISVIIPMYNAAKTIERCIHSVMNQSFQDLEIIIIDDGSTDGCQDIAREIAETDQRIKVYPQDNHGASSARNHGLSVCRGEYICFIDSDDAVEKEYIESLYQGIRAKDSDIALCGYVEVGESSEKKYILSAEEEMKLQGLIETDYFVLRLFAGSPCMKIFRSDIIKQNHLRFREDMITAEDQYFNFQYYEHCRSITFINRPLYIYYRNESYLSMKRTVQCMENEIEKIQYGIQFMQKQHIGSWEQIIAASICYAARRYVFLTDAGNSPVQCCRRLKRMTLLKAHIRLPLWQNDIIYQLLLRGHCFPAYLYLWLRRYVLKK
ncbi:MAG: glycosyltransferase [Clostridiales bacterium]|nr:glycosyltransferase [Clostridiales bacterium]